VDVKSRNGEKFAFFELFGPPCRITLADLDGSTPECVQVCALHIEPHLEALRKIEMVAVHCTNEFLTPLLPAPQGPMDPRGRRGTSVDIVSTRIQFGVDPSTVAEISLKNHQNAKNPH